MKSGSLHDWAKKTFCQDQNNATAIAVQTACAPKQTIVHLFDKAVHTQYKTHFFTAVHIVLKEKPLTDFESLIAPQKKNGVKFVTGKLTHHRCREFIGYLSKAIREDASAILQNANFFGCEQDGSEAHKTREEKELVFSKVVIRGKPVELLLKCPKMSDFGGVSAALTKAAIDDAFSEYGVQNNNKYATCLVSACADGASVNMGRLNGALTTLKRENRPWLLIIHCSAHRIELAVKDTFRDSGEFERIDDMMLNLHIFFKNSGKGWRIFKLFAENLNVIIQQFPKSAGTRFQIHKYRGLISYTIFHYVYLLQI